MGLTSLVGCRSAPCGPIKETTQARLLASIFGAYQQRSPFSLHSPKVKRDSRGRPFLVGWGTDNLHISFSSCGDHLWAAASVGTPVGIDVESPCSFSSPYPYDNVFSEKELQLLSSFFPGNMPAGAALFWTCKEAAVKARGSGFTDISPIEVTVTRLTRCDKLFHAEVHAQKNYQAVAKQVDGLWQTLAEPEIDYDKIIS